MNFIKPYVNILLSIGVVSLATYVAVLLYQNNALHDASVSLTATVAHVKLVGEEQNAKTDRIEQGARQAAQLSATMYLTDLEKVKRYNEAHIASKPITHSMCNNATNSSSGSLSSLPTAAEAITANGKDADAAATGASIEQSCAITTLQYNTLYKAWIDACAIFECK